ncbi:DUF763 domain-containing protein [Patescibacteria group bacterium]|nr:DUF763 domain-containing protein [Patescibacteria group bacterium]
MHRGIATFTLDYGKCPKWLFDRMVFLGREMMEVIIAEEGPDEFVKRIADPVWFQSLGTVLAFDWNASGLTTILTAALKEAIRGRERELGIFICGGKGKTSLKVPSEITNWGNRLGLNEKRTNALIYNSKMSAKVDSSLVQDNYSIYHHSFFFSLGNKNKSSVIASKAKQSRFDEIATSQTPRNDKLLTSGSWAVVQQGMNLENQTARRYHWYSSQAQTNADYMRTTQTKNNQCGHNIVSEVSLKSAKFATKSKEFDFVCEPHSGISQVGGENSETVLNLVAKESDKTRKLSTDLVGGGYKTLIKDIQLLRKHSSSLSQMAKFKINKNQLTLLNLENTEFKTHPAIKEDFSKSKYLEKILWKACDAKPENYENLLSLQGVGPKTMRALALVGEVIYGANPSYEDPARYSFAHGGKDSTPYPVDCSTYDFTIEKMKTFVKKTKIGNLEKNKIIKKLNNDN